MACCRKDWRTSQGEINGEGYPAMALIGAGQLTRDDPPMSASEKAKAQKRKAWDIGSANSGRGPGLRIV